MTIICHPFTSFPIIHPIPTVDIIMIQLLDSVINNVPLYSNSERSLQTDSYNNDVFLSNHYPTLNRQGSPTSRSVSTFSDEMSLLDSPDFAPNPNPKPLPKCVLVMCFIL